MRNLDIEGVVGGGAIGSLDGRGNLFDLTDGVTAPGFVMAFSRNEEIYGEGESADFVYKVVSGAVRTTRILADGRRQIADFHLAGDVFGLEDGEAHGLCAEAITDCRIALVKRVALERIADHDCGAARKLRGLTAGDLRRLQGHMLLLGRKGAVERVAAFLLEMSQRAPAGEAVDLPMSRTDIADYLGLTIETVSRSMTQLERDGCIGLPSSRHVELRDRRALRALTA
jgi:CRP/FNR family nitrogen fixation transcriptional regulator